MAKKKLPDHHHDDPEPAHPYQADGSVETIRNLKSLNAVLLKETTEKRRQVESLERRRDDLEVKKLRRMGAAVKDLEEELSRASEESVGLEVNRCVACCFLDAWRGEAVIEVGWLVAETEEGVRIAWERVEEIERALDSERWRVRAVFEERDAVVTERGELVEKAKRLMGKLQEAEEARRLVDEGLEAAKMENERLGRERVEGEGVIRDLTKEKEAVKKELMEVWTKVGKLRSKVEELEMINEDIRREKKGKNSDIGELGKEVARLTWAEVILRKEEEKLRSKLLELESFHVTALEKIKEREMEIGALSKESGAKETMILKLKGAFDSLEKDLRTAEESLEGKGRLIEEMEKKRVKLEELVDRKGDEIVALNREISKLKDVIARLESSCRDQEEKNKVLVEEVSSCNDALDGVKSEKDEVEKLLFEERQNVTITSSKLSEMERKLAESTESSKAIQGERDGLYKGKTEVESKLSSCLEENELSEKRLSRVQQTIDNLEAKIKLAGVKYEQISMILKTTVVPLVKENGSEENSPAEQKVVEEDFEVYAKEMDAIESAFRNNECAVEELKQQLEGFKESATRAHKEKGLWTLVSSATTLVAAASVAYLARGR